MLTIVGVDVVGGCKTGAETDDGGFFAKVEVAIAADTGFGVHFAGFFLEEANERHLVVVVEQCAAVFTLWYGCLRLFLYGRRSVWYIALFVLRCIQGALTFLNRERNESRPYRP